MRQREEILKKLALQQTHQFGDIYPSGQIPVSQGEALYPMVMGLTSHMLPGLGQLYRAPQALAYAHYARRFGVNAPSALRMMASGRAMRGGRAALETWAKGVGPDDAFRIFGGRTVQGTRGAQKLVKNIGKRTSGIGWVLVYPAIQTAEYLINRPKVKRQAAAEGAAAYARNPFLMYYTNPKYKKQSSIGGTMTKAAQVEEAMKQVERIQTIRKVAAIRWAMMVLPEEHRVKTAAPQSLDQIFGNVGVMNRLRKFLPSGFFRKDVLSAILGAGGVAVLERLLHNSLTSPSGSRKSAWKKLVNRYPEFDDDQHRELFEAIHAFSPTVASVPATVAPILRSASDYGAEGIDINTARTLSSIEGRPTAGFLETNLTPKFLYNAMRDAEADTRRGEGSGTLVRANGRVI